MPRRSAKRYNACKRKKTSSRNEFSRVQAKITFWLTRIEANGGAEISTVDPDAQVNFAWMNFAWFKQNSVTQNSFMHSTNFRMVHAKITLAATRVRSTLVTMCRPSRNFAWFEEILRDSSKISMQNSRATMTQPISQTANNPVQPVMWRLFTVIPTRLTSGTTKRILDTMPKMTAIYAPTGKSCHSTDFKSAKTAALTDVTRTEEFVKTVQTEKNAPLIKPDGLSAATRTKAVLIR
jgi:hypothetical protein